QLCGRVCRRLSFENPIRTGWGFLFYNRFWKPADLMKSGSQRAIQCRAALGMEEASPDLEKLRLKSLVFLNREYSGQPDP
ncbi:hypothetical protein, partial [Flavobacterium sp. DG2-3]|uniref:hypothetical protein n=1 Tax=Flavobacterium sp. DG2-3 TaxID=3068317 RepID=UPI00273F429E